jgi:hypothetical protein
MYVVVGFGELEVAGVARLRVNSWPGGLGLVAALQACGPRLRSLEAPVLLITLLLSYLPILVGTSGVSAMAPVVSPFLPLWHPVTHLYSL